MMWTTVINSDWDNILLKSNVNGITLRIDPTLTVIKYLCKEPKIEDATQEPENCKDRLASVECLPAPNVRCRLSNGTVFKFGGEEVGFSKSIPCRNVSGYSYKVAVALSLFLGWIGADRFYLGYPALGLLKFCTVGFCGIGSLVDFMLISMQVDPYETTQQMYRHKCSCHVNLIFSLDSFLPCPNIKAHGHARLFCGKDKRPRLEFFNMAHVCAELMLVPLLQALFGRSNFFPPLTSSIFSINPSIISLFL
ncbi:TM2 domain-containing protein Y66D12A.21-like isoform X2 [Myxocyprinus asiaticus]|uniref:TM2 domain-containing protein Y66D12A.21-like isoform X2 n=1 Tax=Myxocyprinus asiaticus TaxID=70543 RepID=UPI002223247A|nr:TM2 domain-containing protein Y66D12A.21-like isoform X2 [Myxocyprinus asiaticus]